MENTVNELRLLPYYFKKIGLVLLIIFLLFLVGLRLFPVHEEVLKELLKIGMLLSLLLLVLSKDKIEDELTLRIRLQAYAVAFIYGVASVIAASFIHLFSHDTGFLYGIKAEATVFSMLFFYFMTYYYLRWKR